MLQYRRRRPVSHLWLCTAVNKDSGPFKASSCALKGTTNRKQLPRCFWFSYSKPTQPTHQFPCFFHFFSRWSSCWTFLLCLHGLSLVLGLDAARSRSSFSRIPWDTRNALWSDGLGDQESYANAVRRWCAFHYTLPDSNANKIMTASRKMVLYSQAYGRAKIRCDAFNDTVLCSKAGVDATVDAF